MEDSPLQEKRVSQSVIRASYTAQPTVGGSPNGSLLKKKKIGIRVKPSSLLTFEGLMGPAKALIDNTGSLGLPVYLDKVLWGLSSV